MQTLDNLIKSLEAKEEVDAVMVTGSTSSGENKEYSDIDLAVIFKENKEKLFSLFQYIDDRPADIFFYDLNTLSKLEADEKIPANTMDSVLVTWLEKGDIRFDKSGTLTSLKKRYSELNAKIEVPKTEMDKWESIINSGYITNKRYFDSNDPEYHELLDIKLLQDSYNLFMGYFEFRNMPWRGEKQMLRYLKQSDPIFYNKFRQLITVGQSIKDRFETYSDLVRVVFVEPYRLWDKDIVNPSIKGPIENEERNRLVEYWNNLMGN